MAVIAVAGPPGCRVEEVARLAALRLKLEAVTEATLRKLIVDEFGSESAVPDNAFPHAMTFLLARLAREHHLVVTAPGSERIVPQFPGALRIGLTATENYRVGALMIDHHLDRGPALDLLRQLERERKNSLKRHFGRVTSRPEEFDLTANAESLESEQIVDLVEGAAYARGLLTHGLLGAAREAEMQFHARLELARHGVHPAGKASLTRKAFAHPSEEVFANLLDFYLIAWEYEPRSFAVQWNKDGEAIEFFTPDFYLPDFDLYVEITTMKQAHVTRKNRKVKLLKSIYPNINIQVFYQKDFQNIVFKHGLPERPLAV
jgi:hypothetical protein